MTADDLPAFTADLVVTAELYGAALSEARIVAYFEALADRPLRAVQTALRAARQTRRFFPLPGDLRELLDGDTEALAAHAFGLVMQNLGDYASEEARDVWREDAALRATVGQLGGLPALKGRHFGGSLWRVFLKLYQAQLAGDVMRQAALPPAVTPRAALPAAHQNGAARKDGQPERIGDLLTLPVVRP